MNLSTACVSLGGNQPEVRERIGEWLARGYGREFLAELDSHFAHLGPGANHAPVAEHLRREFAAEIEKAWQEDDELLIHDCDLDATRFGKETMFDFARHRRTEHYGLIVSQIGIVPPKG